MNQKKERIIKMEHSVSSVSDLGYSQLKSEGSIKISHKKGQKSPRKPCKRRYTAVTANVPKRHYTAIKRKLRKKRHIIELKSQTTEREHCDSFIYSCASGCATDDIIPESIAHMVWKMHNCFQRRDYSDLAKLISQFTQSPMGKKRWYSTVIKYCSAVLLHDQLVYNSGLIDLFLEGVVGCHTDVDKKSFLKDVCRLPKNIHVTRYDDLWIKYSQPNQLDRSNIDKLCRLLNAQTIARESEDSADDSSSYDENNSSSDDSVDNATSDAELPINLDQEITILENTLDEQIK